MENQLGSLSDGRIEFTCWYDGMPAIERVPVSDWSQSFSGGAQVSGSTAITIHDESGKLAPWGVDEPLGVGGSILQSRLVLDSASVSLGYQRITASSCTETWRKAHGRDMWIASGTVINVDAEDLTVVVAGNKFVSPEAPPTGSTCIAEIRRLLTGIMDVTFESGVADMLIPPALTYRDERMDAVEDLVAAMGAAYRVSGTGQLVVYMPNRISVWTVKPGEFEGNLIAIQRSQSISHLKNLIVARNTLQGGAELQAAAEERSGPLRTTGPHGRWPDFYQADFATNQYDIQEAATNHLNTSLRSRTVSIPLTTIFHPGLEVGDWITVMSPVTTGSTMALEGRVSSIGYSGKRLPVSMDITLDCELNSVQSISDALKAQRWSE